MMKHNDVYKKFKIEYDKANVTSSYPSLTDQEIAVMLDKAYLALIAQKFTGNNNRGAGFESDAKAIEDIRPLLSTKDNIQVVTSTMSGIDNSACVNIANDIQDMLYYVQAVGKLLTHTFTLTLISHESAKNFMQTSTNVPWIKQPVGYMESGKLIILYDPISKNRPNTLNITYIKKPKSFESNLNDKATVDFELNDSMAEELINLAIIMTLETVESSRLKTKLNLSSLES